MKLRVKIDNQSYSVEVGSLQDRPVLATVDGEVYEVWPEEERVETSRFTPAPTAAPRPTGVNTPKAVTAPIPGVILSLQVKEGDAVVFGQELCILEAMKMKNQIRANRAGTIGAARVSAGEQVRHGQVLFEFTE